MAVRVDILLVPGRGMWPTKLRPAVDAPALRMPKREKNDAIDWQPALVYSRRDMDGVGGIVKQHNGYIIAYSQPNNEPIELL